MVDLDSIHRATCRLCKSSAVEDMLDLGKQPVLNRFLARSSDAEYTHPLVVGQCQSCGLIQTTCVAPVEELKPIYGWITNFEPERHLDTVADTIARLPGLRLDSRICGLSFKDDTLLDRMRMRGFRATFRVDPEKDLGISDPRAGVETIQNHLDERSAAEISRARGKFDVVIARHILEHAHNLDNFIAATKTLMSPDGYAVLEAPDNTTALANLDYSMTWEEHTIYFTPETFKNSFGLAGFSLDCFHIYPYALENCLVGFGRILPTRQVIVPDRRSLQIELERGNGYSQSFPKQKAAIDRFMDEFKKSRGRIAMFGAGHLCGGFINFLGVGRHVEFVADDNPNKKGMLMPGSRVPICGSADLLARDIKLCLLSLNPESQEKIIASNHAFLEKGAEFASIFPASKRAIKFG